MNNEDKRNILPTIHPDMLAALEASGRDLIFHCGHGKLWTADCPECDAVWEDKMGDPRIKELEAKLAASQVQVQSLREALRVHGKHGIYGEVCEVYRIIASSTPEQENEP